MMHAPEMSPTLDDALRALDGASVTGVMSASHLAAVRGFLEQLNDVRDVPAVMLEPAQAAALEGAYQAGVRCADESGHVLVVSLPSLLHLLQEKTIVSERTYVLDPAEWLIRRPFATLAAACSFAALAAALVDHDAEVAAWLAFGAVGWGLLEYVVAPMFKSSGAKQHG